MPKRKELVEQALKKADMKQASLARLLGMSPQKLNHHFTKDDMDKDMFELIADKLKEKGITINGAISQTVSGVSGSTTTEGDMHGILIGDQKEVHYHSQITESLIKEIVTPYKEQIEMLKEKIAEKDIRITELLGQIKNKK